MEYNEFKKGATMDIQSAQALVSTLGFPIVMVGAMAYFVKYMFDTNKAQIDDMNEKHKTEMDDVKEALNNNTLAITKLFDLLNQMKGSDES